MKLVLAMVLALACGSALAANKCVLNGKVEYMDTPCPSDATSSTVRTDRPNSLDTTRSYSLGRAASKTIACDEAKETHRHNPGREQKAAVASACGPMSGAERAQLRAQQAAAGERTTKEFRAKMLKSQENSHKALQRALSR